MISTKKNARQIINNFFFLIWKELNNIRRCSEWNVFFCHLCRCKADLIIHFLKRNLYILTDYKRIIQFMFALFNVFMKNSFSVYYIFK